LIDELLSATNQKCPILLKIGDVPSKSWADKRLLRHIFSNLLSNAVKYSPENSPVEWTIDREEEWAVCQIKDGGLGIPEQDLQWLFRAFHRGHNVGHLPGTGLGLTIVKRCIELHRGSIQIGSTVGKGTTVTLRLPLFRTTEPA